MTSKTSIEMNGALRHRAGVRPGLLFTVAALVPALFALACGSDAPETVERPAVEAATIVVQPATVSSTRSVAGTVVSSNVSPLASKVVGNVLRVLVSEGDMVRAGQLLVEIDAREGEAQIDSARAGGIEIERSIDAAQANATLAETTLRRYAALFERRAVSAQELDDVRARRDSARAELARLVAKRGETGAAIRQAQTFAAYSSIRSPIDGVVTRRFVDPGAQAAPGMALVIVEDVRSFRVEATVAEGIHLRPGDPVTVEVEGARIEGRVKNIQPGVDATSRSSLVKIALGTTPAPLRSGAYARVLLPSGSRTALMVPPSAIVRRGQLTSVFIVDDDGVARMRLITIGEDSEVISGLEPGERIVTEPSKVTDGAKITRGVA